MHWLDPDYLPEHSALFERFLVNPHGAADGMILTDGTEVHFPPHLSDALRAVIRVGEKPKVRIRGVRPRRGDVLAAVAIETMDGERVVDNGPPPEEHDEDRRRGNGSKKPKRELMQAQGNIRRVLHGPKGEVRGALLENGTIIRVPAGDAERIEQLLSPGRMLAVRGEGLVSELGTVVEAREVGPSADRLQPLKPKKPKHAGERDHHAKAPPA
jgi:hypothetical protein